MLFVCFYSLISPDIGLNEPLFDLELGILGGLVGGEQHTWSTPSCGVGEKGQAERHHSPKESFPAPAAGPFGWSHWRFGNMNAMANVFGSLLA